jgi:hypothetical protein
MVLVSLEAGACCDATRVALKSAGRKESFILAAMQMDNIQSE